MTFRPRPIIRFAALVFCLGCACTNEPRSTNPKDSSLIYRNNYFGLQLTIPEGWTVAQGADASLFDEGLQLLAGEDRAFGAEMEATKTDGIQLLVVSKRAFGSPGTGANANLVLTAVRNDPIDGYVDAKELCSEVAEMLVATNATRPNLQYELLHATQPEIFGGRMFYRTDLFASGEFGGFRQAYIATIHKGHSVSYGLLFVLSFVTSDEHVELLNILNTLQLPRSGY